MWPSQHDTIDAFPILFGVVIHGYLIPAHNVLGMSMELPISKTRYQAAVKQLFSLSLSHLSPISLPSLPGDMLLVLFGLAKQQQISEYEHLSPLSRHNKFFENTVLLGPKVGKELGQTGDRILGLARQFTLLEHSTRLLQLPLFFQHGPQLVDDTGCQFIR